MTLDEKLTNEILESDKRSFDGRKNRLKFLFEETGEKHYLIPKIALEYFEESRLCFYHGAFVASILMANASFEELFRQIYRDANDLEKANAQGLAKLTEHVLADKFILDEEKQILDKLRKLRNEFTHIEVKYDKDEAKIKGKKTYLDVDLLWGDPRQETLPIEDLAKKAIKILVSLLPELCHRFYF